MAGPMSWTDILDYFSRRRATTGQTMDPRAAYELGQGAVTAGRTAQLQQQQLANEQTRLGLQGRSLDIQEGAISGQRRAQEAALPFQAIGTLATADYLTKGGVRGGGSWLWDKASSLFPSSQPTTPGGGPAGLGNLTGTEDLGTSSLSNLTGTEELGSFGASEGGGVGSFGVGAGIGGSAMFVNALQQSASHGGTVPFAQQTTAEQLLSSPTKIALGPEESLTGGGPAIGPLTQWLFPNSPWAQVENWFGEQESGKFGPFLGNLTGNKGTGGVGQTLTDVATGGLPNFVSSLGF